MKSKSKLDKLKMPAKGKMDMSELDMAPEGSSEEEASESPDEAAAEGDSEDQGKAIDLSSLSDDELVAEMKKRGLIGELDDSGKPAPEAPSEEYPA